MNTLYHLTAAAALLITIPVSSSADVHPSALFVDNMVLQRGVNDPVWGTADPAEKVVVTLAGKTASAIADGSGHWLTKLPALPAGGPYTLTIAGKNTVTVSNVLVGDVWLCSGQSNMQYAMAWHQDYYASDITASDDPQLRCFTVANKTSPLPISDLLPSSSSQQIWQAASPKTVPSFTAVGYFFARELRKQLDVPIGIIQSAWGGTNGESWVSRAALSADPELKVLADTQIKAMESYAVDKAQFPGLIAQWEDKNADKDAGNTGEAKGWAKPDFSDVDWKTAPAPLNFSQLGMHSGGSVWLRRTLDLPADAAGKAFTWNLGWSADDVTGYCNGVKLPVSPSTPEAPFFTGPHSFTVPAELVHAGANTFALRIFSHAASGTLSPGTDKMNFPTTTFPADADQWHYQIEHANAPLSAEAAASLPKSPDATPQNTATYIYNSQIAPLMPFAIRGVIWYQGENNSQRAKQYQKILPTLITSWRSQWGEGSFPFYIVQLANYGGNPPQPGRSAWAELREAQLMTAQKVPNTGLAITMDIGEGDNIHPKNKQEVGRRLALIALAKDYGHAIPFSGPLFSGMTATGDTAKLTFSHVDGGLVAKGGPLKYFAIAGDDKKFVWADAKIVGDTVLVGSSQVAHPAAVRYAWADNPDGANLYNGAGLPASPFRTDADVVVPPTAKAALKKSGLLLNGDFSSPPVPADKDYLIANADGWTYDLIGSGPVIGVESWKKDRPPFLLWNNPSGTIVQTASAKTLPKIKTGDTYFLSYSYGGQGKGSYTLVTSLLVDGKVVLSDTKDVDVTKPGVDRTGGLSYPIKASDIGKSVGVSFTFSEKPGLNVQSALTDVMLTVAPPVPVK